MTNRSIVPLQRTAFKTAVGAATLAALLSLATSGRAQTDSFDNGYLDPAAGWATLTAPNFPTFYTFPTDAFGGKAFRMQGGVPLNAGATSHDGTATARAAAVCTNTVYGDFYVAADLVNWDTNLYRNTNYSFVGLTARVNTDLSGISSGVGWNGLALFYWNNVDTQNINTNAPASPSNADGPGTGAIGIGWVINGCVYFNAPMLATPGGVGLSAIAEWTLNPGHTYRLTFQGVGDYLTAKVYDTQDLTRALGTISGDTSLSTYVFAGQVWFQPPPTSGWSGLCALRYSDNYDTNGVTDATFDNFYAAAAPPTAAVSAPGIPNGEAGVAQVTSRTPASWANFYSPAGGITFTGSTLTTTATINTSATRLLLNGMDISSSLTITPTSPATNVSVSFGLSGSAYSLAPNMVYDASIILQDSLGRKTTNVWTFDTFTEAYLNTYGNIECEDYDFLGGAYIPFPVPASGFSTNDNTWYWPAGDVQAPLGYGYGINCYLNQTLSDVGYVGVRGVNAYPDGTSGDYYECARTAPMAGRPLDLPTLATAGGINLNSLLPACEYRTGALGWPDTVPNTVNNAMNGDTAGTQAGGAFGLSILSLTANNGYLQANFLRDTKRQKYAALNVAGLAQAGGVPSNVGTTGSDQLSWWDVEEYNVVATDGSDWFNYTHDWGTATNYNVYLRNACAKSQHLYLYNDATTNRASQVGTFNCTNALQWNWRYTPLLDGSGNPAVVNLGGTTTLRLEVNPEEPKWTSIARGLALNYMAFVPTGRAQLVTNVVLSTTNRITSVVKGSANFTVNAFGTPGAKYYLVTSGNIKTTMGSWTPVAGSTNTASAGGTWSATVSAAAPAYYRAVAINPHP